MTRGRYTGHGKILDSCVGGYVVYPRTGPLNRGYPLCLVSNISVYLSRVYPQDGHLVCVSNSPRPPLGPFRTGGSAL